MVRSKSAKARRKAKLKARQKQQEDSAVTHKLPVREKIDRSPSASLPTAQTTENPLARLEKKRKRKRRKRGKKSKAVNGLEDGARTGKERVGEASRKGASVHEEVGGAFGLVNRYSKVAQSLPSPASSSRAKVVKQAKVAKVAKSRKVRRKMSESSEESSVPDEERETEDDREEDLEEKNFSEKETEDETMLDDKVSNKDDDYDEKEDDEEEDEDDDEEEEEVELEEEEEEDDDEEEEQEEVILEEEEDDDDDDDEDEEDVEDEEDEDEDEDEDEGESEAKSDDDRVDENEEYMGFETGDSRVVRRLRKTRESDVESDDDSDESDDDEDFSLSKSGASVSVGRFVMERVDKKARLSKETSETSGKDSASLVQSNKQRKDKKKASRESTRDEKSSRKRRRVEQAVVTKKSAYELISNFVSPIKPSGLTLLPPPRACSGRESPLEAVEEPVRLTTSQPTFPTSAYDYDEEPPSEEARQAASKVRDLLRSRRLKASAPSESGSSSNERAPTKIVKAKATTTVKAKEQIESSAQAKPSSKSQASKSQVHDLNQGSIVTKLIRKTQEKTSQDFVALSTTQKGSTRTSSTVKRIVTPPSRSLPHNHPPWYLNGAYERVPRHGHLWLHNEILNFVKFIDSTDFEKPMRDKTIKFVKQLVGKLWPHAKTEVFGSVVNNLVTPNSDIDMVVLNAPSKAIHSLANACRDSDECEMIQVILKTKVPLIKLRLKGMTHIADISFAQLGGIRTGAFVRDLLETIPQLRPLTMVIKYFLKQRGLNDPFHGGLGSHQCLLSIVSMMQHVRRRLIGSAESGYELPAPIESYEDLGSLLLEYFKLYGIDYNYATTKIVLHGAGYYVKKQPGENNNRGGHFSMSNPEEPAQDIGATAWRMPPIRRAFSLAARTLALKVVKHKQTQPGNLPRSILSSIITVDKRLAERYEHLHNLDVDMSSE